MTLAKALLRNALKLKRRQLAVSLRRHKDRLIAKHFWALPEYQKAKTILFYKSHGSEAGTEVLLQQAFKDRKKVVLPYVRGRDLRLSLLQPKTPFVRGAFGIEEVTPRHRRNVRLKYLSLVVVPGIAFDRQGLRLGHGLGYYDRFLAKCVKAGVKNFVGLAYHLQRVKKIPQQAWDVPVNVLVTEKKVYRIKTPL